MSATSLHGNGNRLLAALPAEEYERLSDSLEPVTLRLSQFLFRPDDSIDHVYFLTTSIVSLMTELEDGGGVEVGLVGREGLVGISAILGGRETKVATVQKTGEALRIRADVLLEEFRRGGTLQSVLLKYTHALMTQISQSVACNTRHQIPGRLARWLLMFHDRAQTDEFELTHEFLANMLGVRRAGVTEAADELQKLGLIENQRGLIKILDRKGLEQYACECYPTVKMRYDEFML
jgi:CRP-like cAMP-binding protein